jgi:hypothetical protein
VRFLVDRLRALGTRPDAAATEAAAPTDDPLLALRYVLTDPAKEAMPRTLISILGAAPGNVGEIIRSVAAACRQRGEYPVAVLSELLPEVIAESDIPIEFMPSRRYLPGAGGAYERYLRRRWSLMLAKWNFASQIELQLGFDEFLAAELSSSAQPSTDQALASASCNGRLALTENTSSSMAAAASEAPLA